jgi:long-chain fatty acid transport protein
MISIFRKIICILLLSSSAFSDDYHYRNILVGEQASGLGGAYVAIADDPSGIYYNPAGIVFGMENYFSLSANAYMQNSRKYQSVIAGQDYNYTSSNLVPTFFGLTQSRGRDKWGFAVVVPNQDSYNQSDQITINSTGPTEASSFKRKYFDQDQTYMIGMAYAKELWKETTGGLSLMGVYRTRNAIDNQLIRYNDNNYFVQEANIDQTTAGLYVKYGMQYMPIPKFSFGATIAKTFTVSSTRKIRTTVIDSKTATNPTEDNPVTSPKLLSPLEVALGMAYFPSKSVLYSADFFYFTEDKDHTDFTAKATWNVAFGTERYLSDSLVMRLGFFTNNANTAPVSSSLTNQLDHVDLYGLTAAVAIRSPGSSVTLGTTFSSGTGQGQAIGNNTRVNTIVEQRSAFYLVGSYQL